MNNKIIVCLLLVLVLPGGVAWAKKINVGPGKKFQRIERALAKARSGDTIWVYPKKENLPYQKVALFIRQKNISIRAVKSKSEKPIPLSGEGHGYSGVGSTPRAIVQFNKGADHGLLEGFELLGAKNKSHNGAGVRINQANHVTIRHCNIHGNDMGIMSNGSKDLKAGVNQNIEYCEVHHNGSEEEPGYNHNLYLGGHSVTLSFCDIHHSLTGHNIKSRAHYTRVQYSFVHDSLNREFDLVDAADTAVPNSHAVLLANLIVKSPSRKGNRGVIHFGQDGGRGHDGKIYLIHNTIITPYISAVVLLSADKAGAVFTGNVFSDGGQKQSNQVVLKSKGKASLQLVSGKYNYFDRGFDFKKSYHLDPKKNVFFKKQRPPFVDAGKRDFHLASNFLHGTKTAKLIFPPNPDVKKERFDVMGYQFHSHSEHKKRPREKKLTLGAFYKQ